MRPSTAPLACPRCQADLVGRSDGQWRCDRCGGALLGRTAVRTMLDAADQGLLPAARSSSYREAAGEASMLTVDCAATEAVSYLACPICAALMLRTRVLRDDPVVADVCVLHALWFDRGELERFMTVLSREGEGSRAALRPLIAKHFPSGPA